MPEIYFLAEFRNFNFIIKNNTGTFEEQNDTFPPWNIVSCYMYHSPGTRASRILLLIGQFGKQ